jgi:8-oxo-dGTP diphosphatase
VTSSPRLRVSVCLPDGDRILLVEHRKGEHRHWLLPGGGVEVGETLIAAAVREVREETGIEVAVGRLVLICEAIEIGGRHLIDMVFAAALVGGDLRAGNDGVLDDAAWRARSELTAVSLHPPIADQLLECWAEGFDGPVRFLGNVWRPED